MIPEKILPFPRGQTYSQCGSSGAGALVTMGDATGHELEGRLYQVKDTIHNTGHWITLRIVKNDQGATAMALDRKLVGFTSASVGDFGRRVGPLAANQGQMAKPIDDAYFYGTESTAATSAVHHTATARDLYYVVEEGPCRILSEVPTKISAGDPATVSATAGLAMESADADSPFGMAMEDGDTAASTATLYYVSPGLMGYEHA